MITNTELEDQEFPHEPEVGHGCSHWVDGKKTWELGFHGWMLKIRGLIVSIILVPLPLAGVPFWWPDKIPERLTISTNVALICLAVVLAVLMVFANQYARRRTFRSLEIKSTMHRLMHDSRDALTKLHEKSTKDISKDQIREALSEQIRMYSNSACETVAHYMAILLNDSSIGCSIRIGIESNKGQIVYRTIGRSKIFNVNREKNSRGIPITHASPCMFLNTPEINCNGVIYYDDIEKAAARKAYEITPNDKSFYNDFDALAVAPINGWNGNSHHLIGLLCLTSKGRAILRIKHIDAIKFLADHFAIVYSSMFAVLNSANSMSNVNEINDR
jgi:hypothetical protein